MVKVPLVGRVMSLVRRPGAASPRKVADRGERLRMAFDQAPVGIALAALDGHWLQVNERFRALVGYTREELARISFHGITHPEDAKRESALLKKLLAGDSESYRITKRVMEKKGRYRAMDVVVSAVRGESGAAEILVYIADDPEHGKARVEPGRDPLVTIVEQLTDVAVIRSDTRGIITGWNAGAERILGYTREEIVGRSRRMLFRDPDTWEGKPTRVFNAAADTGKLESDDWRVSKSGTHLWVKTAITPIRQDGEVRGYIEVITAPAVAPATIDPSPNSAAMQQTIDELRAQVEKGKRVEASLREAVEAVRIMSEETMNELRIMTVALRNEIDRRKHVEEELRIAREELASVPPPVVVAEPEEELVETAPPSWSAVDGSSTDVLIAHAGEEHSGTLRFVSGEREKEFFFDRGRIFSCASNDATTHLTQRLVARGWLSEEQREKAVEIRRETHLALGRILLILGAITEEQLVAVMHEKLVDEVAAIAAWSDARWAFVDGEVRSLLLVPLRDDPAELVAEAAARTVAAVVVASKKTRKFHRPTCIGVRRLAAASRIELASAAEATRQGFAPCRTCQSG